MKKALSYSDIEEFLIKHHHEAKDLYIVRDYTAKQLAEHFQIMFTQNFPKVCFKVFGRKGKGWGGARYGAGNDKLGREDREKRKKGHHTIAVKIAPDNMDFLRSLPGSSYADIIDRALRYYQKAVLPEKPIENEAEYESALESIDEKFDHLQAPDSIEGDKLNHQLQSVKRYEDTYYPIIDKKEP